MGAYLILFPRVRVFTLVPLGFYATSLALPRGPCSSLGFSAGGWRGPSMFDEQTGGVAFWAHLGGFLAGVVLIKLFERRDRVTAHSSHHWQPKHVGWS